MKVAFDSYMVNQVVAEIHKDNHPSIDLVERLGFRCIEVKGNFKLFAANSILSSWICLFAIVATEFNPS